MCHTDEDVTPVLARPNTHTRETNHGREYDPPPPPGTPPAKWLSLKNTHVCAW